MNERFKIGSDAATQFLEFISFTDSLIRRGELEEAQKILKAAHAVGKLLENLSGLEEAIAAVADGQIRSASRGGFHYYASAHDAVRYAWVWLDINVRLPDWQLPENVADYLGIDTSLLSSHLVRERARYLEKVAATEPTPATPVNDLRQNEVAAVMAMYDEDVKRAIETKQLEAYNVGRKKFITSDSLIRYLKTMAESLAKERSTRKKRS